MAVNVEDDSVRWTEILNRRYASPLILVCLGVWLHAADGLIVATMLPSIVADIGGRALVAWTTALYEIGSIVAGASSGLLALKAGVRRPMALAALVFAAGCLISALAPTMTILLFGRLLQGLGGGGLTAMSFIAVAVLFPARLTARAMAAISALWGASAFLGPLIGGAFVTYATWRLGFVFFALQALLLAAWVFFGIRVTERPAGIEAAGRVPFVRLLVLCLGVVLVAYSGIKVTAVGTPLLLAAGFGCLAAFLWLDDRSRGNRLLPKNPFSFATPLGAALVMVLAMNIAAMGLTTYGPLLMTAIHGVSALTAGYVVAAIAIGWTLAAVVVSGAPERLDRRHIAIGMSLVFVSIAGLVFSVPNGPVWLIAVFAAMEGVGYGMSWTFIIRRARALTDMADVERLSGALPTVGRLGYALGAATSGILANAAGFADATSPSELHLVARTIFIGCLPIALLGLVAMARFISAKNAAASRVEP